MSAPNFTPIQLYRTTTASAVPSAGNLADGELAINLTDEALYFKNASGVVTLLADSSGALGSVTSVNASGGTTGLTFSGGPITSSGTLTLGGTLAVANGGTGVTVSTGTGRVVLNDSPVFVTPALGAATATSITTQLGSVGAPSFSFTSDTNTGMWSPSSDAIAFSTAGSERLRVDSSGNVGVGTASPGAKLVVSDAGTGFVSFAPANASTSLVMRLGYNTDYSQITADSFGGNLLIGADESNTKANSFIAFRTDATERMRIDSSGNVGIGTSSPGFRLEVAGNQRIAKIGAGYEAGMLSFSTLSETGAIYRMGMASGGALAIGRSDTNTTNITLDSSGNVGIGTTAPSAPLSINSATNGAYAQRIGVDDPGTGTVSSVKLGFDVKAIGANPEPAAYIGVEESSVSSVQGSLTFATRQVNNNTVAPVEAMRITSAGNVGIGTSSPSVKLDVVGQIFASGGVRSTASQPISVYTGTADAQRMEILTSGTDGVLRASRAGGTIPNMLFSIDATERMRITSAGNVGIGTSSPNSRLDSAASASGTIATPFRATNSAFASGSPGQGAQIGFANDSGWGSALAGAVRSQVTNTGNGASAMSFHNWNGSALTEYMRIDSSGNVGIGTSSPGAKLDVAGGDIYVRTGGRVLTDTVQGYSGLTTPLALGAAQTVTISTASTERMRIDSSGNVGIGTTNPAGWRLKLDKADAQHLNMFNTAGNGVRINMADQSWQAEIEQNAGNLLFKTGGTTERMRIDGSGNLLVGTTSNTNTSKVFALATASGPAYACQGYSGDVSTPAVIFGKFDNDSTTSQVLVRFTINNNSTGSGQINADGANSAAFGSYSDARLKENIVDLPPQLANVLSLRPVEFDYIASEGGGHQTGFIAQEMQEVYPDVVGERFDGMLTITGWSKTEARLVKAIQEQQEIINDLRARVAQLEGN